MQTVDRKQQNEIAVTITSNSEATKNADQKILPRRPENNTNAEVLTTRKKKT
jgi:hypothetical protein